jgi:NH3-dependent NAD+ synthetase
MKTKQQKEDCARICAKLGITKEQYDEIDRACERAAKRFTQQSLQRLRKKEKQA